MTEESEETDTNIGSLLRLWVVLESALPCHTLFRNRKRIFVLKRTNAQQLLGNWRGAHGSS